MEENPNPEVLALQNLVDLEKNYYPGRLIVTGMNKDGLHLVQLYAITGRSPETQNRRMTYLGKGEVRTEFADPSKNTGNPELLLYVAMSEKDGSYAVSNGKQTDDVRICGITSSGDVNQYGLLNPRFVGNWSYEDDDNHTSRIAAFCLLPKNGKPSMEMAILKKSPLNDDCEQFVYRFGSLVPGFGRFISTYSGENTKPLPAYSKDPLTLSLYGNIETLTQRYWDALTSPRLVSLAVKFINIETGESTVKIMNQYEKVG